MLGTVLALLALWAMATQYAVQAGREDLFADGPTDHNAFISAKITRMRDDPSDVPLVAIIGESVTLSSFGTERAVAEAFRARTGQEVEVINLASGRQPILFSLMLIDRLPRNRPVHVVLGSGPSRFTMESDEVGALYGGGYFSVGSALEQRLARENGLTTPFTKGTGIAMIDHRVFFNSRAEAFARNLMKLALTGEAPRQNLDLYQGETTSPQAFRRRAIEVATRFMDADLNKSMIFNKDMFARSAALVESRNYMTLAIVEHPIHPRFVTEYLGPDLYRRHIADMRRFAAAEGVPYWTIGADLELGEADFVDWAHVSSASAQRDLRNALVDRMAREVL